MTAMRAPVLTSAVLFLLAMPACSSTKRVHVTSSPLTVEVRSASANAAGPWMLHLDDLRLPEAKGTILRVYVNVPRATAATGTEHPGFVDELILVPSRSQASASTPRAREGQNFVLPLPDSVRGAARITVTLVPVRGDAKGELSVPAATDVTMKRPYVTSGR